VKLLLICPFPVEFNACKEILGLTDSRPLSGCRSARVGMGEPVVLAGGVD